ncbi:MAG TPA: cation-translocating P-type ATPase [Bacilli bacterium]
MDRKNNRAALTGVSAILIGAGWISRWTAADPAVFAILMIAGSVLSGVPIIKRALAALRYRTFSIELLVSIAVIGSVLLGEYWEAAAVAFLFMFGAFLEARTLEKTRSSLRTLMNLAPLTASVLRDGEEFRIAPEEVMKGDIVLVRPGEKIPVDGKVISGASSVNQAAITGESIPVTKKAADPVFSGTVVESGYLHVQAERVGEDTTFSRIIALVEEAQDAKAPTQAYIERFAKYYTPAIFALAAIVYLLTFNAELALTLLVIACPGALVIAAPVAVVAGIGKAASLGLLIKGGHVLERAARINAVAFDKTGTLTTGKPVVAAIHPLRTTRGKLLELAARAEAASEHHLAKAIAQAAKQEGIAVSAGQARFAHFPGKGIKAEWDGQTILVGNRTLLHEHGVQPAADAAALYLGEEEAGSTAIYIAADADVLGVIAVADAIRADACPTIRSLREIGMRRVIMLTGDNANTAANAANALGIGEIRARLLPEDKVAAIRDMRQQKLQVAMVGDGVNDAPALTAADLGIAIGGTGTDAALEIADVVIASGKISQLPLVFKLSAFATGIMKQNIGFAVAVVLGLLIGVLSGAIVLASGMLIHEASVLLVIINALRILRYKADGQIRKPYQNEWREEWL